jgi:hypothetical protein
MSDDDSSRSGVIYIVQSVTGGPVKIGFTERPTVVNRIAGLQTAHANKLILRAAKPGTMAAERRIHTLFKEERMLGEWFALSERIVWFIDMLQGAWTLDEAIDAARTRPATESSWQEFAITESHAVIFFALPANCLMSARRSGVGPVVLREVHRSSKQAIRWYTLAAVREWLTSHKQPFIIRYQLWPTLVKPADEVMSLPSWRPNG